MKKPTFADLSIFFVNRAFNTRFFLAGLTRKSKLAHKIIDKLLFEDDEIIVIPNTLNLNKTKTATSDSNSKTIEAKIEINQTIEDVKSTFLPTDIIKEAVKQSTYIFVMDNCICRTSNDCEDYPHDIGCMFLGDATKQIPRHLGREVTAEEAIKHIDQANAAGLSHLIGRNKIDSVWMNVGPKEDLLTICHCCPCCCLWKVVPNLEEDIGDRVEKLEGVSVNFNSEKCTGCKRCIDSCFVKAITFNEETKTIEIDQNKCRGCGKCVNICKQEAISINYTKQSVDAILNRIQNLVDYTK